jgi:hypothetical protein
MAEGIENLAYSEILFWLDFIASETKAIAEGGKKNVCPAMFFTCLKPCRAL